MQLSGVHLRDMGPEQVPTGALPEMHPQRFSPKRHFRKPLQREPHAKK